MANGCRIRSLGSCADTRAGGEVAEMRVQIDGTEWVPKKELFGVEALKLLFEIYASIWAESHYDAMNDDTRAYALKLYPKLERLNALWGFHK